MARFHSLAITSVNGVIFIVDIYDVTNPYSSYRSNPMQSSGIVPQKTKIQWLIDSDVVDRVGMAAIKRKMRPSQVVEEVLATHLPEYQITAPEEETANAA